MPDFGVVARREITEQDRAALESRGYSVEWAAGPAEVPLSRDPSEEWSRVGSPIYVIKGLAADDPSEALDRVATALGLSTVEAKETLRVVRSGED